MTKFSLIMQAAMRDKLRWARRHLYSILILSPLVVGMTYATLSRVTSYAPEGWRPSLVAGLALGWLASACIVALSLSRASTEIFHLRTPEAFLDAMPISPATHFHTALATRLARTGVISLALLVARWLLGATVAATGDAPGSDFANSDSTNSDFAGSDLANAILIGGSDAFWSIPLIIHLALFVALTAFAQTLAALAWIHWGHTRKGAQVALPGVCVVLTTFLSGAFLLLSVYSDALPVRWRVWLPGAGLVWAAALYALARRAHEAWRASDLEYAKRLQAAGGWSVFGARLLKRAGSRAIAAQLARDLQLTLRAFSSAVYVCAGLAALWTIALAVVLFTDWLPSAPLLASGEQDALAKFLETTWLAHALAAKVACVLATASLASLVPVVVAYQLPHLWLERAAGARGAEMWRAKMLYTRIITLPAPVAAFALAVSSGAIPLVYALPLLAEMLWLWWMLSTLLGALAYEMPEQPGLSIVLLAFISAAAGLFSALLWPVGIAAYGMTIDQVRERGAQRAQFYLAAEEI